MDELKEAIKAMAGMKCAGECEKDKYACYLHCSNYSDCAVVSDFFARIGKAEADADKVLSGLDELEDPEDRRAFIVSYGILCGMKKVG